MSDLSGKVVVITGGGTGIGLGIAKALAAEGCKVVIGGRREQKVREAAESCDPPLYFHKVNVAHRRSVKYLFEWVEKELGPVDILINSAGTNIKNRKMADMDPEQWDEVMLANATGAYNCIHAVLPNMREKGDGVIVNISSIAGKRAAALGGVAYCASKFAMTALGTAVGNEVACEGVRVTNVYPGEVNTPILENRPAPVSEERKAKMLMPEDLGHMVAAICKLPPRAHVPEMVIKPLVQEYI
jgi:NADP-dependent 3-hydroxy acid dehydrogenase YdfG